MAARRTYLRLAFFLVAELVRLLEDQNEAEHLTVVQVGATLLEAHAIGWQF